MLLLAGEAWQGDVSAAPIFATAVSASSDDAFEDTSDHSVNIDSVCNPVGAGAQNNRKVGWVGLRFQNVTIPQGSIITAKTGTDSTYLRFSCKVASLGSANVYIKAEASDNAYAFAATASNLSARPQTTASVLWTCSGGGAVQWDAKYISFDIASVLQEIVNRPGWSSGMSINFLIHNNAAAPNGWFGAGTFDNGAGYACSLHVYNYTAPPSTQTALITFSAVTSTGMTIGWQRGNGANCAVFMYQGTSGSASPVYGTTYTQNTTFGSGTQIGSSGWYCIYNGSGTSVTVTGLTTKTFYRIMACEYNSSGATTLYQTSSSAAGNPANYATYPNLALGKTVTASSAGGGNFASKATDGGSGTRWESTQGVDPQTMYVDLGTGYYVDSVYIDWETASANHYQIQGSNDAINWTTIKDTTDGLSQQHRLRSFSFTKTLYRYIQMYGYTRTTGYGYSIWEFGVYGDTNKVPATQASAVTYSSVTSTGMTLGWTRGSGANCAVFVYAGASGNAAPVYGTTYTANTAFGSGTQIGSSGWYCVYNGAGTSVAVTGLTQGTAYQTMVCEYNSSGASTAYNTNTATSNPSNQITAPGTQATTVTFGSITSSGMTIGWTNGNGTSRAVFVYQGTTGNAAPVYGTTYTASTTYGSGTQAGAGWYCVYNGTGTSVAITGLAASTAYRAMVCEYNSTGPGASYNTGTGTGNPANQTSAAAGAPATPTGLTSGTLTATTAALSWSTSTGATSYEIQVSVTSGFTSVLIDQTGISSTSYSATGLSASTTYYARVNATSAGGTSAWSGNYSFTTSAASGSLDDYNKWAYSASVVLNTTNSGGGANVATDQSNFPVLVRLTSSNSNIFSQAKSDGTDIRFSKSDGTHIPYQIERWDNADNMAEIWVKFDVKGNNSTQYFMMYWGNSGAGDSSGASAVFATANNFLGVWHLKEGGNTTAGGYADATGVYPATGNNMASADQVAAVIDSGQSYGSGTGGKAISLFRNGLGSGCTINITTVTAGVINAINSTPTAGGSGYAVGDQLLVAGGDWGIARVTAVSGTTVTGVTINESPAPGAGCTINTTAAGGNLTAATVNVASTSGMYCVGDILSVAGGTGGTVKVTGIAVNGGGVTALAVQNAGTGYTTATAVATTTTNLYTVSAGNATTDFGPGIALSAGQTLTFYAWVVSTGSSQASCIFDMATATNGNYIFMARKDANNLTVSTKGVNDNGAYTTDNSYPVTTSTWTHIGFTVDGSGNVAIYVNGVSRATTLGTGYPKAITAGNYFLNTLGSRYYNGPSQFFQGTINEAVVSNAVCSADWIKLCYQNQQNVAVGGSGQLVSSITCSPAAPTLSNPANGSTNQTTTPSLSWGTSTGATSYRVQVSTNSDCSSPIYDQSGIASTSQTVSPALSNSTVYYWRVSAANSGGSSGFSSIWSFTTTSSNHAPTDMSLSNKVFNTTTPVGARIGTFFTTDVDLPNDFHTYTFNGGTNDASFSIAGNALYLASTLSAGTYHINVRTTDQGALHFDSTFTLTVQTCSGACTDNYSQWQYSKRITLNTTRTGANVTNTVTNFPVLVSLNPGNFSWFSQTRPGGTDIRFSTNDSAATHLPYQIERWSINSGNSDTAEIWVLISSVAGSNNLQTFKMYWGKSDAADSSNGPAVFATSNGFVGVYHLSEGGTGTRYNSAQSSHNGTTVSYDGDEKGTGLVGVGDYLTTNDGINLGDIEITTAITLSAWVNPNSLIGRGRFISKQWTTNAAPWQSYALQWDNSGTPLVQLQLAVNGAQTDATMTTALTSGTWAYVAGTYDGTTMTAYLNGTSNGTPTTAAGSISATTRNATIAYNEDAGDQRFNGSIDEVRIENTARSADWIRLCYQNQQTSQNLVDPDDYSEWKYSKNIVLNTSPTGANVATPQADFPVLVRLTSGTFNFSQAQDSGQDIRFAKSNGAHLKYQIERWDRSNQLAEIWVRVDTVYGNNGSQYFTMYWGKSPVDSRSNGAAVFDTANGFSAVYHLNDASSVSPKADATANGNGALDTNTTTFTQASAVAGFGAQSGNLSGHLVVPASVINAGTNGGTISFWAKGTATGNGRYLFCTSNTATERFNLFANGTTMSCNLGDGTNIGGTNTVFDGNNHYLSLAWNSDGSGACYVDGASVGSHSAQTLAAPPGPIYVNWGGSYYGSSHQYALYDEFRAEKTARSADWIKLCYWNQNPNQTLLDSALEDYTKWAFSKNITINAGGLGLSGKVPRFPYLVRLNKTNFDFSQAQSSGQDIRFSRSDGAHFPYQIERWNSTSTVDSAEIWVLVDTVYNNSTQYFKMYWGNAGAQSWSNGQKVFETSNGFIGVYHLSEGGTGTRNNSAQNAYNGTTVSYDGTESRSGDIGAGDSLKAGASTDGINLGTGIAPTNITLSAWVKEHTVTTWGKIINKEFATTNTAPYEIFTLQSGNGTGIAELTLDLNGNEAKSVMTHTLTVDGWNYVAGTYDQVTERTYYNGAPDGTNASTYPIGTSAMATCIGYNDATGQGAQRFNGVVDEVRIENVTRSADWIKLCYNNQMQNSTLSTLDSADAFRPLFIQKAPLDSITVSTTKWAIKFSAAKGGGIKFLAKDSVSTNQLDTNLFTIMYNNASCDAATGTLALVDSDVVHARIRQQVTISSQPFTVDYNVLGSGKLFARVTTYAASNLAAAPLEFRIAHNAAGSTHVDTARYGSTPSSCFGLLHEDSTAGFYDILMAPFVPWSQANATTSSNKFMGIKCTSWSLAAMSRQTWEFMVDFGHTTLHDSTKALAYVNDFQNPDTMHFYEGTPLLEKAWENQLSGHWKFDEGAGDTAGDNSSSGNVGWIRHGPAGNWTSGMWGGGDSLRGIDSITVAPGSSFFGNSAGFTILGWVKPATTLTASSVLFKKYSTASNSGYELTGTSSGQLQLLINNAGLSHTLTGKTVLGTGQWYHVGAQLAYTRDTLKLYVNGVIDTMLVASTIGYPGATSTTVDSEVMGQNFNGVLDDMRFYGNQIDDGQIKAIYLKGFAPDMGRYSIRADNNSTVQANLNGLTYNRYLPAFKITNYWGTGGNADVPQFVYLDGTQLTAGSDYFAGTDQKRHTLAIGLNRTINANSVIYISGTSASNVNLTNAMPQMYWGTVGTSPQHFYVKNFAGDYLGSSTANQFYMDWKMDSSVNSKDGEIYCLKTSKMSANQLADTTGASSSGNLVPIPGDSSTWGYQYLKVGGNWISSAVNICSAPTYTVVESSAVRVAVQLNDRKIANGADTVALRTRWTIYPTGQIFRWDSIFTVKNGSSAANVDSARADFFETYSSNGTSRVLDTCERGGIRGSSHIQDFESAFLSARQGSTYWVQHPYVGPAPDTVIWASNNVAGNHYSGARYYGGLVGGNLWSNGNLPFQMAYYLDISRSSIGGNTGLDSVGRGVQNFEHPVAASTTAHPLTMSTGALLSGSSATTGDLDTNGFNEREGAYVIDATGCGNTVQFTLNAAKSTPTVDTCRFYPAFRIKGYYAATPPQYVFVNSNLKTSGYDYNVYLNNTNQEVVLQFNQVFCGDSVIYISYDHTLAVTMTNFKGLSGDRNDTLRWKTESEQENLGFYIYKRIKPSFMDSLVAQHTSAQGDTASGDNALLCLRKKLISTDDTVWKQLNSRIIPGAAGGISSGPRNYSLVDYDVNNDIEYEYRLESVDFSNKHDAYPGYADVRPGRILPMIFDLRPNYPNPFRALTMIRYAIPVKTRVDLFVYNLQGRLIRKLVDAARLEPGFYKAVWNGKDDYGRTVASGPYIYRLQSPLFVKSHVMILSK